MTFRPTRWVTVSIVSLPLSNLGKFWMFSVKTFPQFAFDVFYSYSNIFIGHFHATSMIPFYSNIYFRSLLFDLFNSIFLIRSSLLSEFTWFVERCLELSRSSISFRPQGTDQGKVGNFHEGFYTVEANLCYRIGPNYIW